MNHKSVACDCSATHIHPFKAAIGKQYRDDSRLGRKANRLEFNLLSSHESIPQAFEGQHKTKTREGPAGLDSKTLRPISGLAFRPFLPAEFSRFEIYFKIAQRLSALRFLPGPLFLNEPWVLPED